MVRIVCLALIFAGLVALGSAALAIEGPAAVYPRLLIFSTLVLMAAVAVIELRRPQEAGADPEMELLAAGPNSARFRFAAVAAIWVAYPLVMPLAGFLLSTTIVLAASTMLLGWRRSVPGLAVGSFAFAVLFAFALKTVIYVPVPEAWPDRLIDQAVYAMRSS